MVVVKNITNYATLGGGVGLFIEVIGNINVAIFWFIAGLLFLENLMPKGTLMTLVSIEGWASKLSKFLFINSGNLTLPLEKYLILSFFESLLIASNTPKNLMLDYSRKI